MEVTFVAATPTEQVQDIHPSPNKGKKAELEAREGLGLVSLVIRDPVLWQEEHQDRTMGMEIEGEQGKTKKPAMNQSHLTVLLPLKPFIHGSKHFTVLHVAGIRCFAFSVQAGHFCGTRSLCRHG